MTISTVDLDLDNKTFLSNFLTFTFIDVKTVKNFFVCSRESILPNQYMTQTFWDVLSLSFFEDYGLNDYAMVANLPNEKRSQNVWKVNICISI